MDNCRVINLNTWSQEAESACLTSRRPGDRDPHRPPVLKDLSPKNPLQKIVDTLPVSGSGSVSVTYLSQSYGSAL